MTMQPSDSFPAGMKPTRARYWVLFAGVTLAILNYMDRVVLGAAAPFITKELGLTSVQMGYAFSAFAWAYAVGAITGWLGDRLGPRKVLTLVVVVWSIFIVLTGRAWNLASLAVAQALFGLFEAGSFPNITKSFTIYLPKREQVRAQGILWMFARFGGALTPLIVVSLLSYMTWRNVYAIFGALGFIWAAFFWRWFRDNPREHKGVNEAELAIMPPPAATASAKAPTPWKVFFTDRTPWLLWAQYAFLSYGWYFYVTWLPTYIVEARGVDLRSGAILAAFPLFFGGLGSLTSGLIAQKVVDWTGDARVARRLLAFTGFGGAAFFLILSLYIENVWLALIVMGMASFSGDLTMPASWGTAMDVGGRYAGTISGFMNMIGNIGGGLGPLAIGYILFYTNRNWTVAFYASAAAFVLAGLCWIFIDPITPLEKKHQIES